jgi:hypothetical protein
MIFNQKILPFFITILLLWIYSFSNTLTTAAEAETSNNQQLIQKVNLRMEQATKEKLTVKNCLTNYLPPGSYQQYCTDCCVSGSGSTMLTCHCHSIDGESKDSWDYLDFSNCVAGTIIADNGNLTCTFQ